MKTRKVFSALFLLILLSPVLIFSQDISVHKFIGKTKSDVITAYGIPVHQDDSNPVMVCMFYQTKTKRMIFVSDQDGVYQSEATASYNTEEKARVEVDTFISGSVEEGFSVDTVSINDFEIYKTGIKADLQLNENKITKKFDLRIKARRSED
jgi:hypothetical protein